MFKFALEQEVYIKSLMSNAIVIAQMKTVGGINQYQLTYYVNGIRQTTWVYELEISPLPKDIEKPKVVNIDGGIGGTGIGASSEALSAKLMVEDFKRWIADEEYLHVGKNEGWLGISKYIFRKATLAERGRCIGVVSGKFDDLTESLLKVIKV